MQRLIRQGAGKTLSGAIIVAAAIMIAWFGAARAESGARGLELLMFDQDGCEWCEQWDAEIGGVYEKTEFAARAPLRRANIHDGAPEDVVLDRRASFTPTFVLLLNGVESGRIEGYPGDEYFWFLLEELIEAANAQKASL